MSIKIFLLTLSIFFISGCSEVSQKYYKKDCIVHIEIMWSNALNEEEKEENFLLLTGKKFHRKLAASASFRDDNWYLIFKKKCDKRFKMTENFFKEERKIFNNFEYKIDTKTIHPSSGKTIDIRSEAWKDGMVYYP